MEQATFAKLEDDVKKRRTRREVFLEKMVGLVPWGRLEEQVKPFYPKAGRGRRSYPLAVMLRVHYVQLFYKLGDPGWRTCSSRWGQCGGSWDCSCRVCCPTGRRS